MTRTTAEMIADHSTTLAPPINSNDARAESRDRSGSLLAMLFVVTVSMALHSRTL
jgi:hypothetical protein